MIRILALSMAMALVCGCSPMHRSVPETELVRMDRYDIIAGIEMPGVSGIRGCGAQALATVMAYADTNEIAGALAEALPWHDTGATPVDLLIEARQRGFAARIERGTIEALRDRVGNSEPTIVMMDAGMEVRGLLFRYPTPNVMHWAVVSGMARDGSQVLLAAERSRHHVADVRDFMRRWEQSDFCMITVTAPDGRNPELTSTNAGAATPYVRDTVTVGAARPLPSAALPDSTAAAQQP